MHTPSPILENPRMTTEIGSYGDHIINPALNLKPGAAVTMVVHALPRAAAKK
jgi:hypothetical protein